MIYTDEDALDIAICSAMATAEVRADFVAGLIERIAPRQRPGWLKARLNSGAQRIALDERGDDGGVRFTHNEVVELVGLAIGKSGRALDNAIREHAQSKASQIDDTCEAVARPHSYVKTLSSESALGAQHPENVL
jgi:hypothetical protein